MNKWTNEVMGMPCECLHEEPDSPASSCSCWPRPSLHGGVQGTKVPSSAPKALSGTHPPALFPDPLASPEGGSGQDAALRANLKMKRGGPQPDGALAALLGPDPGQKSADRASGRK